VSGIRFDAGGPNGKIGDWRKIARSASCQAEGCGLMNMSAQAFVTALMKSVQA
jgi:hypothetical protein